MFFKVAFRYGYLLLCYSAFLLSLSEKPIVIVVPSYNNERWCIKNLDSIINQKYDNYRVVYIDDASADRTFEFVQQYCNEHNIQECITIVHNTKRVGAMANLYKAIHSCQDDEIIITVDGDDWLPHDGVLEYINKVYQDENVWITWGQFQMYPSRCKGFCKDFPEEVVRSNSYRKHEMPVSHLRTFYAWLFKLIDKNDLLYRGQFYPVTWDKAMMAPMIEMASGRYACISEVLYIYNFSNPISDCRMHGRLQVNLEAEIFSKQPYAPIDIPIKKGVVIPLSVN